MSLDKLISAVAEALAPTITDSPEPTALDRRQASKTAIQIRTSTQNELTGTLAALGFGTAATLSASGHKLPVSEIDTALSKANVSIQDRIRLKNAMARAGILTK